MTQHQDNRVEDLTGGFRDKISTVDTSGNRIWIYPKKPKGRFYQYRKYVSYALLLILFGMPFINVNGRPLMLFNIPETEFIIFGVYFAPQDFHIFVIAMLIGMLGIVLFTVVYGRLFCGWVCPQTIFMEMVFRRIEYWIEGDANAQKRLAKSPWTADKIIKKVIKHTVFIVISVAIAHTFLSYIIGVDALWEVVTDPIGEHLTGFIAMVVFTAVFYGVFSVMREQVCTTICPYGRLQGVLLDDSSLTVAYDFQRGEPRGKKKRRANTTSTIISLPVEQETPIGDCVDCSLCVQVCPTGIDIRNGTQLECINCTACMDACDEVMTKIDRPTGLIRIDSHAGIRDSRSSVWTPRVYAYSGVLIALVVLEAFLFMLRSPVETLLLRTPGMLYQENGDYITNLYNYQLVNKTEDVMLVTFEVEGKDYILFEPVGKPPTTTSNANTEGAIFIKIPRDKLKGRKTELSIKVYGDGRPIDDVETTFLAPGQ